MPRKRTRDSAQCKCQRALEAAKGLKTINALARAHGVHPHQVSAWKRQLLEAGRTLFSRAGAPHHRAPPAREVELDEHLGRLKMALEWLKKHAAQQPPPALGAGRVAPLAMR